jgi:nucleoside 2-deoxyribosyltransferase
LADEVSFFLQQPEDERLEFKRKFPPESVAAKVLTAFANAHGGVLLLGVGEHGEVVGLSAEESEIAADRLLRIGRSLRIPVSRVSSQVVGDKIVTYAVVEPAADDVKPLATAGGQVFVREGTSIRPFTKPGPPTPTERRQIRLFVAMSFREEEEAALADYFAAMKRAVAVTLLPIQIVRIDLVEGDYEISQRVMTEIDRADVVLADYTLSPANVYFEVGYARGKGKRLIQSARAGTVLEFDTRNWRTLFYRNATQLEAMLGEALSDAYAEVTS